MPGPTPHSLWIDEYDGRLIVTFDVYDWHGNVGNRKTRAIKMLRRILRGDWICRWCGDDLPVWRRVDSRYCTEGCRKRAARLRRASKERLY